MLAEVVEKLKKKTEVQAASPAHCYAGPGDVECDFCTETKNKAVMSRLKCLASFCETHLKPHYEAPGLKKHKLVKASGNLQEKICSEHDKVLEIYCRTDQSFICYLCTMDKHRGHNTVAAKAERTEKQSELKEEQMKSQQRIQEKQKKVQELKQAVNTIKSFQSLCVSSGREDSPSITVNQHLSFDGVRKSLSNLKNRLEEFCQEEFIKIPKHGAEHAESALEGAGCSHCERLPLRVLRSRKALFEEGAFTREPRGAGPASAEAERRLHSWGSQLDLAEGMETGESLSPSSPSRSSARQRSGSGRLAASFEACRAASPVPCRFAAPGHRASRFYCAREQLAVRHRDVVLAHIKELGLRLNAGKSVLSPVQRTTYLGVVWDSTMMQARLSPARIESICTAVARVREGRSLTVKQFQKLLGLMAVAASIVIPFGLLYMRPIQWWLKARGFSLRGNPLRMIRVMRQCLCALDMWRKPGFLSQGPVLGAPGSRVMLATDASLTGWGAVMCGRSARGLWSGRHLTLHINCLEMLAVFLALKHFLPDLRGRHVLVCTDNTAVAYYINHQGGLRSRPLYRLALQVLVWSQGKLLSLKAAYIPGRLNMGADTLSRQGPMPREWRLHPEVVEQIWRVFGRAQSSLDEETVCPEVETFHFLVRRPPARPCSLPSWYSAGVLAGPPLHGADPLHPEGVAIAAYHAPLGGQSVGRHPLVTRFLHGVLRLRPPVRSRVPPWDLAVVLEALCKPPFEPIEKISDRLLTLKTAFLLAISSLRRVGDLQALSVAPSYLDFAPGLAKAFLYPRAGYVPKVPSSAPRPVVLQAFCPPPFREPDHRKLNCTCPVRALDAYVHRTALWRKADQLFVCFGPPKRGRPATKQTLSRWIVDATSLAYESSGLPSPLGVKAHSTEGVAASRFGVVWRFARFYGMDIRATPSSSVLVP
ncbi:hypothetical protein PDJAM_G00193080 [Pangasius djambal]|uniref:Uncharacterized protein n=1 Tax=Pangasius djambal TaxID=1691987 RepID=A0ACC5ZP39_9TELE|nr:hypothetical protein [Pangasius djambal]